MMMVIPYADGRDSLRRPLLRHVLTSRCFEPAPLQVVRYHPGEKYEPHHDLFDLCDFPQKPRRHLTFLIYLNDLPAGAGGATTFPRLNLAVQPEKGMALVFNDVLDSGMDDERTEHSGTPPSSGVKYAINWSAGWCLERCCAHTAAVVCLRRPACMHSPWRCAHTPPHICRPSCDSLG